MREYGVWLRSVGLDGLSQHRAGGRLIGPLDSAFSEPLLDALELHDASAVASLLSLEDYDATWLIEETMIAFCSYTIPGLTYQHFPSIDSRAFREHDPGLIGFRH